jgi:hypothetical protein
VIVDQVKSGLVEDSPSVSLSNSKTDSIGKTLTKRSSCDFNAWGIV